MEADRRTIAKELYDSIGASLTAIEFSLEQHLSEKEDNQLILKVQNNGCGFGITDLNHNKKLSEGYGIESMLDRVEIFDGIFNIEFNPDEGACLSVYLPCHSNRAT